MTNNKSHQTAIKRNKLSAPMEYLYLIGIRFGGQLDYGCGRGNDADILCMEKYDPFYFPNEEVLRAKYSFITCNYVLNVVSLPEQVEILAKINDLLLDNGVAFITVRRDVKQDGYTSKGTFQRNVVLDLPVVREKKGHFCTYRLDKTV